MLNEAMPLLCNSRPAGGKTDERTFDSHRRQGDEEEARQHVCAEFQEKKDALLYGNSGHPVLLNIQIPPDAGCRCGVPAVQPLRWIFGAVEKPVRGTPMVSGALIPTRILEAFPQHAVDQSLFHLLRRPCAPDTGIFAE